MSRGLVLVIEDDEWVARLLAGAIRDAGYDVTACDTARGGLDAACEADPDCILCDVTLPDHDGYWVARNVRTQPSRVAVTPFLFLSGLDDQESRLEGLHVGADVYMTKPFRIDEVVAQVDALVQMAARLRERRSSFLSAPPASLAAIQGDVAQMSIATVLTVLELERRTGTFEVVSKKRRGLVDIAAGFVVEAVLGGTRVAPIVALQTMLRWTVGRFSFVPGPACQAPPDRRPIGALLIEAVRLEDESGREDEAGPASARRGKEPSLPAPALGGPPSTADDFAPPSSRAPPRPRSNAPPPPPPPEESDSPTRRREPELVRAPPLRVTGLKLSASPARPALSPPPLARPASGAHKPADGPAPRVPGLVLRPPSPPRPRPAPDAETKKR